MTLSQWQWIEENLPQENFSCTDLACGTSIFFKKFQERLLPTSYGLDFSQVALKFSKKELKTFHFKQMNLEFLSSQSLPQNQDIILSIDGLYNLNNLNSIFKYIHKSLPRNGQFLMTWTQTKKSQPQLRSLSKLYKNLIVKEFTEDLNSRWESTIHYLEQDQGITLKNSSPYLWEALYNEAKMNLKLPTKRFIFLATKS